MTDRKIMKDISLNAPVSVTLPAHIWIGFVAAYGSTNRWSSEDASAIAAQAVTELFDPVFIKEREAAHHEQHEKHQSMMEAILTGQRPEVPPHMEGDDLV